MHANQSTLQVEQLKKKKSKKPSTTKKDEAKEESADALAPDAVEDASGQPEPSQDADKAIEDDKLDESSPSGTPSLAQQSKLRSASFRTGSTPGSGALSPGPLSPDGETAPDIYRKHVARIEDLEKENKKLSKEHADSEKRWQKAEEELADLREADAEPSSSKGDKDSEIDKLVSCWSL